MFRRFGGEVAHEFAVVRFERVFGVGGGVLWHGEGIRQAGGFEPVGHLVVHDGLGREFPGQTVYFARPEKGAVQKDLQPHLGLALFGGGHPPAGLGVGAEAGQKEECGGGVGEKLHWKWGWRVACLR